MRPLTGGRLELLGRLAEMPFLDRLEMAAVTGRSTGAVYEAVRQLEHAGLISSVPHGIDLVPPTRRFHVTADGLYRLAGEEVTSRAGLLRGLPVSARWRSVLMERLDAVAVIYRLVSAIVDVVHPIGRFRWYRGLPLDAALELPGGRTVGIVRQGLATDRTGFSKRLWRLASGPRPGVVLLLSPDEVRLRYARRLLFQTPVTALLALEREAATAGPDDAVWRLPSVNARAGLRPAIDRLPHGGALPAERPLARPSMPGSIGGTGTGGKIPGHMVPVLLRPAEKRLLDLLSDWPWIALDNMAGLLGVTRQRASTLATALQGAGLLARRHGGDGGRLVLTDAGLAVLARRDRASIGAAKGRWSSVPADAGNWRDVTGSRTRQLLRNMEHTASVHGFLAALSRQARDLGWETIQLDPPRRASRYFRHFGQLRSIQPDAFGVIRRNEITWSFFLEWERRAVRPVTMAARLAPYLRYYSTHRPIDDHGARPSVLIVFEEDLPGVHFMRVALEEMARSKTPLPLLVSYRSLLEREGPLGQAWRAPSDQEPGFPL